MFNPLKQLKETYDCKIKIQNECWSHTRKTLCL